MLKTGHDLFASCLRIRKIEEKIAELYPSDRIQSPVHLSIGQEAVSVGVCAALEKTDLAFGTYRSHALYLAKGGSLKKMMAELYGKKTGCGNGKAGSMHLSDRDCGFLGSSAIVASTIPHAVGAALAAKIQKKDQIVVCFFGEGATGEGVYHESLNFAAKKKVPVLFICENNGLAIYTRTKDTHAFEVSEHAKPYGIPSQVIENGMDFMNIYETAREKIKEIRSGSGPQLLEIFTYRYYQHVGPKKDYDMGYRDHSELEAWERKDPLCTNYDLVKKFEAQIDQEIEEAVQFAENSPFPSDEDLFRDVY